MRATEGQDSKGASLEQNSKRCLPGHVDWNSHRGNFGNSRCQIYLGGMGTPDVSQSRFDGRSKLSGIQIRVNPVENGTLRGQ